MTKARKELLEKAAKDTREQWQIDQGNKCPCRGADEYCPCQNSIFKAKIAESDDE